MVLGKSELQRTMSKCFGPFLWKQRTCEESWAVEYIKSQNPEQVDEVMAESTHIFSSMCYLWTFELRSENFKNILATEVPTLDFIECHHLWIRYSYVRVTFLCVGCVCVCVCARAHSVMSDSLRPTGPYPTRFFCPWNFPGRNTGVGCHALLQGIFPTQESNWCLLCPLYWQADYLPLPHLGSPVLFISLPKFKVFFLLCL